MSYSKHKLIHKKIHLKNMVRISDYLVERGVILHRQNSAIHFKFILS